MGHLKMVLLRVVVDFVLFTVCLAQTWSSYRKRNDCEISSGNVMDTQTSSSLPACTLICKVKVWCKSISWNSVTGACLLSQHDTTFENSGRSYQMSLGSTCMSKIQLPVFMALKTTYTNTRYEMTYEEAVKRCEDLGTSIASVDDLTLAQSLGLHYCACGWLSNGQNALILQYSHYSCGTVQVGPNICYYSRADVWCKT